MEGVGGRVNSNGGEDVGKSFPDFALNVDSEGLTLRDCKEGDVGREWKLVEHGFERGKGT